MTIEIFQNGQKKNDVNNPPTRNRFFVFLLQHHRERFQSICQRAGVTVEDYNQILEHFDKRGGSVDHYSTDQIDEIYMRQELCSQHRKNEINLYTTLDKYQIC
eukprot:2585132-Amphidinium_carterae.1